MPIHVNVSYLLIWGHRTFLSASQGLKNKAITPHYDLCSEQQCKIKPYHQRNRLEFPIRHKQFPGRFVSKGFCKIIVHSPLICNREVGKGHLRMGLKPQLKREYLPDSSWVRPLYCVGPSRKRQRRVLYKAGSEPVGAGLGAAWADIQGTRQRGLQILSQGLPLTRVMEITGS